MVPRINHAGPFYGSDNVGINLARLIAFVRCKAIMEAVFVSLLNGVVYGLLLFMVSAGLTLVFGMMGVLNFAHGSFYMLGAYAAFAISRYAGFVNGLIFGTIFIGVLGYLTETYLLRKVRRFGHTQELLLTFGVAFAATEVVSIVFGPYAMPYTVPHWLQFTLFTVGQTTYPFYRIMIAGVAILMFVLLFLLLRLTRAGLVVRAAVRAPDMVAALGHNVPAIFSFLFAAGAALAGLAGAIGGAFYVTSPNIGAELGVMAFVIVVVGGIGSLGGALAASILIGVLINVTAAIDGTLGDLLNHLNLLQARPLSGPLSVPLSATAGTIPFILMLLMLLVRPSGLGGERR